MAKACPAGAEGWQYSSDHRKILLCGSIRDEVKVDASAKIDIVLGCATIVE